jgi:hypothetical protein
MEIPYLTVSALFLLRARVQAAGKFDGRHGAMALNTNSKLKTEMTSTIETAFYKEPTHDEIALSAFLAWQKDGRPHGTDFDHWIEAERRLRAQHQKQADAAAAQAAKPWPPTTRNVKAKPTTQTTSSKPSLTSNRERATAVKVTRPATKRTARATAMKATR